ncbi:MAG TPA: cupredoxin family copper-binding protein [Steroidobacteraceae bacterium]
MHARAALLALIGGTLVARAPIADGDAGTSDAGATRSQRVTIEGLRFSPATLSVRRGATVVWINKDLVPHSVTADGRQFDSQSIAPQSSWTYRALKAGSFDYHCTYHPAMKGRLIVQ